jgi:hypothetical protein
MISFENNLTILCVLDAGTRRYGTLMNLVNRFTISMGVAVLEEDDSTAKHLFVFAWMIRSEGKMSRNEWQCIIVDNNINSVNEQQFIHRESN